MKQFCALCLALLALAGCATPTQMMLDAEVKRLCAIDGGIKAYETVALPADNFNQWGQVNFYRPTQGEEALGTQYIFRSEDHIIRQGNPNVVRYHHQVIRRLDQKTLGEAISYGRGGGDIPGPWEPSNFHCPKSSDSSEVALFKKIFVLKTRE